MAARKEVEEDLMEFLVEEKSKPAEQRTWPKSVTVSPDVTYARASSPRPMSPRPTPKPASMTPATGKSVRFSDMGTTPAIFRLKAEFQAEREMRERQERDARLLSAKQGEWRFVIPSPCMFANSIDPIVDSSRPSRSTSRLVARPGQRRGRGRGSPGLPFSTGVDFDEVRGAYKGLDFGCEPSASAGSKREPTAATT